MPYNHFRIYKTVLGKLRKDGSIICKSYGCNDHVHCVTEDTLWLDENGQAVAGRTGKKPPVFIGKCTRDRTCKSLGGFIVAAAFPDDLETCDDCAYNIPCQREHGVRYISNEDFNPAWYLSVRRDACQLHKEAEWLSIGKE